MFRLSLQKCSESLWAESYARNLTIDAKRAVYEGSRSRVLFDLAAEEGDPVLEAEADSEGSEMEMEMEVEMEDRWIGEESDRMLKEMMPVAFLLNGKRLYDPVNLQEALCNAVSPSKPPICQKKKAIVSERLHPTAVHLSIFVNTNCNNNLAALSPLMDWIVSDPR